MRNVKCAGGGEWEKAIRNDRGRRIRYEQTSEPCNWTGRRGGAYPDDWIRLNPTVLTTKPCPSCGGKVELIQPQPSP